MMGRRPDSSTGSASAIGVEGLENLPALDNRWALYIRRRLGPDTVDTDISAPEERVSWTIVFVAFLGYIFAITTYRLPIGNLAMLAGLGGIALHADRIRFPRLLVWFAAFLLWCAIGYVRTPYPAPVWDRLIELVKV